MLDLSAARDFGGWQRVAAGQIPVVLLVRDHSAIPHINVAQSTSEMDWKNIELRVFSTDTSLASGLFAVPGGKLEPLKAYSDGKKYLVMSNPLEGQVNWRVTRFELK